jgi:hypothetical protein
MSQDQHILQEIRKEAGLQFAWSCLHLLALGLQVVMLPFSGLPKVVMLG